MIFAVIHIFKMTNWKKIFLHDTFVYWFFTLSLSPIWIGWHVWKMWHIIKFHFHMRPFQQRKKRIRYYLGKRARGDRELQTHFSHIAVALVMARGEYGDKACIPLCRKKFLNHHTRSGCFSLEGMIIWLFRNLCLFSFEVILLKCILPSPLNVIKNTFNSCNICLLGGVMKLMYPFSE